MAHRLHISSIRRDSVGAIVEAIHDYPLLKDLGEPRHLKRDHRPGKSHDHEVVEGKRRLPDLSAQLPGQQWRRHRRSAGHHRPAGLPEGTGRRRRLAVAGLQVAERRQRLRHQRLPGHHGRVRHARRLGGTAGRDARARHPDGHGPRRQPQFRRAPLVRREPQEQGQPLPRLLYLAAGQGRAGAEQLGILLQRLGLAIRRGDRRILPAPVLQEAAGPELGEPRPPAARSTR